MTFNPHPIVMKAVAEQRHAELQAQADHERLARRATSNGGSPYLQHVPDLVAAIAIVLGLALMLAGSAASAESWSQTQLGLVQMADDADTNVVQKVREAAN